MEFSPPLKEEFEDDPEPPPSSIQVTADAGHVFVSILAYFYLDPENLDEDEYVPAGTFVEWHVEQWNAVEEEWVEVTEGALGDKETETDGLGQAGAEILTGTRAGEMFRVYIILPGFSTETRYYSTEIYVVAGVTKRMTFQSSLDTEPAAPDNTFEVKATLYDQFDNLVISSETETYFYETGLFQIAEEYNPSPDGNGQVTVRLQFKELIENETPAVLTAEADSYVGSTTLNTSPVVAQLFAEVPPGTGTPVLNIDTPETVTLRARFRHANGENLRDGIAINWQATNGQILSSQNTLIDGEATAVFSAAGGIPGPAVITVTQAGGAYGANGEVLLRQPNSAEVDCPFLPFDEEHSCPLLIKGPANGGARITGGGTAQLTLYSFDFETQETTLAGVFTPDASDRGALIVGAGAWQSAMPGGGHGLNCAGSRCGFVKGHARHAFRTGLVLNAYIIPTSASASGTILSKGGDARLYLESSKVKFQASTTEGTVVLSSLILETDITPDANGGYTIHAEFYLGMMRLTVNGQEVSVALTGFLVGSPGPIGLGADMAAASGGLYQPQNVFSGLLDNVQIIRIVRVRTSSTQLTLDANGQGSFDLTLDGGPDAAGGEGDEINTEVVAVTVLVEITTAGGTVVASRSTQVLLTGRQHGANLEASTGEQGAGLSLGWEMIRHALLEQLLSPVRSVQYLCSIPFRDEVDWKQAGLSLWDVLTTVPIPGVQLARMKQIQKLVQAGGRMGKTVLLVTKLAGRAQQVQNLLGYAGTLYTVYELAGATLEIVEMVMESKKDLDVLKLLHDYLEGNSRPLLEMVLDAGETGLNAAASGGAAAAAFAGGAKAGSAWRMRRRKQLASFSAEEEVNVLLRTGPTARAHGKKLYSLEAGRDFHIYRRIFRRGKYQYPDRPDLDFSPKCLLKIVRLLAQRVHDGKLPLKSYVQAVKRLQQDGAPSFGNLNNIVFFLLKGDEHDLVDIDFVEQKTDMDGLGQDGGRHQLKHSSRSRQRENPTPPPPFLGPPLLPHPRKPATRSVQAWCIKARKAAGGDMSKVHFHSQFPKEALQPKLQSWLSNEGVNVHTFTLNNTICNS